MIAMLIYNRRSVAHTERRDVVQVYMEHFTAAPRGASDTQMR
jgi:hypothetical protein